MSKLILILLLISCGGEGVGAKTKVSSRNANSTYTIEKKLINAITLNERENVKEILDQNKEIIKKKLHFNNYPIYFARDVEMLKLLIEKGADINVISYGECYLTSLINPTMSYNENNLKLIKELLKHDNLNVSKVYKDDNGSDITALYHFIRHFHHYYHIEREFLYNGESEYFEIMDKIVGKYEFDNENTYEESALSAVLYEYDNFENNIKKRKHNFYEHLDKRIDYSTGEHQEIEEKIKETFGIIKEQFEEVVQIIIKKTKSKIKESSEAQEKIESFNSEKRV